MATTSNSELDVTPEPNPGGSTALLAKILLPDCDQVAVDEFKVNTHAAPSPALSEFAPMIRTSADAFKARAYPKKTTTLLVLASFAVRVGPC
jgi:hypothetical protein